jgi:hypothetical protein
MKVRWEDGYHNEGEAEFSGPERMKGTDLAVMIAEMEHEQCAEAYVRGGTVIILEPTEFAGSYSIETSWEPSFHATKAA